MATLGRTLFRLTGAVLLGASATSMDNPRLLFAPGRRVKMVPVVVATRDLPAGVAIDRSSITVMQWPAGTTPPGRYSTVETLVNRMTRVPVFKGEALVPGRLAPQGTDPGLDVRITPGKRAFGIRVDDAAGLAGLVQPNSRVDIMVVINDRGRGGQVAKLFMENMRVLAIAVATERPQDGRPIQAAVASIEVTPTEAERLAIAAAQGSLQLVLRGYGDPDVSGPDVDQGRRPVLKDLLLRRGQSERVRVAPPPVRPARPDSFALKVFRGTSTAEDLKFAKDSATRADSLRRRR